MAHTALDVLKFVVGSLIFQLFVAIPIVLALGLTANWLSRRVGGQLMKEWGGLLIGAAIVGVIFFVRTR